MERPFRLERADKAIVLNLGGGVACMQGKHTRSEVQSDHPETKTKMGKKKEQEKQQAGRATATPTDGKEVGTDREPGNEAFDNPLWGGRERGQLHGTSIVALHDGLFVKNQRKTMQKQ